MTQRRILLIDDDRACLQALRDRLREAGYQVMTATDGPQGLVLARAKSPDLIVTELLLPGLDGFEICQMLKQDADYAHIPIIILSGVFISQEDRQQGLQLGNERHVLQADAYLSKPPGHEQLLRQIRVLLGETTPPAFRRDNQILIVDGDDSHRKFLERTLSDKGYPVVGAANGVQGWSCFQAAEPSFVLLDSHISGLDGLALLTRMRDQDPDVAVILMATSDLEPIIAQALRRGADGYLVKPLELPCQIASATQTGLELARLRRLNRQLKAHLRDSNLHLLQKHRALQSQNSALQDAYQHLLELERLRQSMIGMVVHDLKNPLNVVILSIDLVAADFGDLLNERQRDILRTANLANQRMLHLITNLLEVQRLEEGKMPVTIQPLEMALVLRVMVGQAEPLAEHKKVSLNLDVPGALPWVLGDVDLVPRIVANLLDNAIKFTPVDGRITVAAEAVDEAIVVSVADNGPGIPPEEHKRIFDKFAQVGQDTSRGDASVGLGLAFCKLAVESLNGRIWVESEIGQGSQFKFTLPICSKKDILARQETM